MTTAALSDSTIYTLPDEIMINIFTYLKPSDILNVRLVCKDWAFLSTVPKIKKKLRLRLDNQNTPEKLIKYLYQNEANFLPVHNIHIVDQEDHPELEYILKSFAMNLKCLRLTNSSVFKNVASAQLNNIQDLDFNYYKTSPKCVNDANLEFIKKYKYLNTLNINCPDELISFYKSILENLLEAETYLPLERLRLSYHVCINDMFLEILLQFGEKIRELDIYFHSQPNPFSTTIWFEVLSQMKNLEILRISGDWAMNMTWSFFESLPKIAPLRCVEISAVFIFGVQ